MRCPNCGADAGDAPFCPQCGADLSGHRRRRRAFATRMDRRIRHFASAVVILVAAISVILVVLSAIPEDVPAPDTPVPDTPIDGPTIPSGALVLDSGYIVLSDSYTDAGFSGEVRTRATDKGAVEELVTTLSAERLGDASKVLWVLRCDRDGSISYIPKSIGPDTTIEDIGRLTWIVSSSGTWTLSADIYSSDGGLIGSSSGSFTYHGAMSATYEWRHSGKTLTVTYSVSLKDYQDASASAAGRTEDSLQAAVSFVSAAQVSDLEQQIWSAYYGAFGGTRAMDYASCLVEFVGACFETVEDRLTYGTAVYWASPIETLYYGQGDSGDLCVLTASLLKAANIGSSLARMPGLWAVGVTATTAGEPVDGTVRIAADIGGSRYWITSLSPFVGIGLVPDIYGYSDGMFSYRGEAAGDGYGIIVVQRASRLYTGRPWARSWHSDSAHRPRSTSWSSWSGPTWTWARARWPPRSGTPRWNAPCGRRRRTGGPSTPGWTPGRRRWF